MQEIRQSTDGVWTFDGQDLHLDLPQLLKICDLPNTQENRNFAVKIATTLAAEQWPDTPIVVTG